MNTIKENKEISKTEARIIQYGKWAMGLYALVVLTIIMLKL
jgi:hypothetical protein